MFGSVARGEADRRSDIDLWVLVEEDRMTNQ
nr:nucleotidyltransferase domain-containing protein [Halosimplex aquaticum]